MLKQILDVVGCVAGLFGCIIAVFIALRQDKQLSGLRGIGEETKEIGRDTRDTARKIETDSYRHEIVRQFFHLGKELTNHKFKCMLPVGWHGKPLPSIHAGDYHALHVLQKLLGSESLDLSFQGSRGEERMEGSDGDVIFLCTPQANPALSEHAPPLEIGINESPASPPQFDGIELPCWFADEILQAPGGGTRRTKKIWICENEGRLKSPAEGEYLRCCEGQKHVPKCSVQKDYAIVLRLTMNETRKLFVIAGIHQYGTWIGGEFLNRLATESDKWILPHEKNAFLQENDVMSIVWGNFDTKKLSVQDLGVHENHLWIRRRDGWGSIRPAN